MASFTAQSLSTQSRQALVTAGICEVRLSSTSSQGRRGLSFGFRPMPARLRICCAAKPETVDKVCVIVRKQLALPADSVLTGASKFQELGADSLDTVEIVMGLEEEFGISVEEENAQSIATVQDAADLIEKLVASRPA